MIKSLEKEIPSQARGGKKKKKKSSKINANHRKKVTQTNDWELFLRFYLLGLVHKHKLLLICGLNWMARREVCRPSKMQTSCVFSIMAVEMHSVKGAFTVPWAQFPWVSEFSFFLTVSYFFHCIYLLSLPSWNFLAIQPIVAQIVSCFVSLNARYVYAGPLSRAVTLKLVLVSLHSLFTCHSDQHLWLLPCNCSLEGFSSPQHSSCAGELLRFVCGWQNGKQMLVKVIYEAEDKHHSVDSPGSGSKWEKWHAVTKLCGIVLNNRKNTDLCN